MYKYIFFIYRLLFTPRLGACRFVPSCSEYTQEAIEKFGLVKGSLLGIKRLLSCQPFANKAILDPLTHESL